MKTYRVAILGCRGRGTAAGRAYHAHPRIEVVGLCDLVPDRLNGLGDELGVTARFDDYDRMIRDTAPDIVAIPTATELHYELGMAVLEHGVHIDIEKPNLHDTRRGRPIDRPRTGKGCSNRRPPPGQGWGGHARCLGRVPEGGDR